MKDAGTRRKLRTRKIEISKYIHLISYNYLKNIVKNLKFKNKNVKYVKNVDFLKLLPNNVKNLIYILEIFKISI